MRVAFLVVSQRSQVPSFTTDIGMINNEAMLYITDILTSRVYDVAIESPSSLPPSCQRSSASIKVKLTRDISLIILGNWIKHRLRYIFVGFLI